MQTHKTIQLAFALGSGDCFFTKDNTFIAVSRKSPIEHQVLKNKGWRMLYHSEVMAEARKIEPCSAPVRIAERPRQTAFKKATIKRSEFIHPDIYEFSDADPGL